MEMKCTVWNENGEKFPVERKHFDLVLLFLFSICILATSLCLVILRYATSKIINQKYLLSNLVLVELVFSLVELLMRFDKLQVITFSRYGAAACMFLRLTIAFVYVTTMHFITLDRLFEVYFHLTYPMKFTKARILCAIGGTWISGLLFAGTLTFVSCYKDKLSEVCQFSFYFFLGADITFVINATVTGTYLYVKYRQFKKSLKQRYRRFRASFKSQKFLLPGLIVLSYLVFETTGSFLSTLMVLLKKPSFIYRKIALILFAMGFLSDCLIYIFINPNARKILARKLALRKRNFQRD